ncbi:MAG: hypothetical protein R3E32_21310 [Chitinophagales bacterium]
MKVGLLLCDHIAPAYQHIAADYPDMFAATFPNFDFEVFAVCDGHFPESVNDCEAYMCTGSHASVYDELDWIVRLKEFIRDIYEHEKKYIGLCFGHQLIGESLGGKVQKAAVGWCVGVHTFEVVKQEKWMLPFQPTYNLLMMCQDQIHQLPPNSTVLASSEDCPIAMIRVGEKILGIQGHPEFTKGYDLEFMENRRERIGTEKVEKGIDSLGMNIDRGLIVGWIENFLGD